MSWVCPNCERKYPDSGIGVPESADADEKTGCQVCYHGIDVTPNDELRELVEQWRETIHYDDTANARGHEVQLRCANELEELIEDE